MTYDWPSINSVSVTMVSGRSSFSYKSPSLRAISSMSFNAANLTYNSPITICNQWQLQYVIKHSKQASFSKRDVNLHSESTDTCTTYVLNRSAESTAESAFTGFNPWQQTRFITVQVENRLKFLANFTSIIWWHKFTWVGNIGTMCE